MPGAVVLRTSKLSGAWSLLTSTEQNVPRFNRFTSSWAKCSTARPSLKTRSSVLRWENGHRGQLSKATCRRETTSPSRNREVHVPVPSNDTSYQRPTTGLLGRLPNALVPYAELARLDKPTGTYYLFLPCLFSTLLAAPLATSIAPPITVFGISSLFFAGAFIMRGAGCTVNDLWDRNLDPRVARTRLRPIARGAITVQQALPFLGVQLLAGLGVLLQFKFQCLLYGVPSLLLVGIYPLAKRITNYPQAILGLTFSWGAIMGFPALGVDLIGNTPAFVTAACLYGSCVAWTIVYDMIYAYQDIRDDAKAGIKSIALAQESNAKNFLTAVAGVQVVLLAGAGMAAGAGPVFFVVSCGGALTTLEHMIRTVKLQDVKDCWAWFQNGVWITGGIITFGLVGEYLAQYYGVYSGSQWERRRDTSSDE